METGIAGAGGEPALAKAAQPLAFALAAADSGIHHTRFNGADYYKA